jgi:uncharacterized protein
VGATATFFVESEFDPLGELAATSPGESEVPPGGIARLEGRLESIEEGIVVAAKVSSSWLGVCRRCAAPTGGDLFVEVHERYVEHPGTDQEAYQLQGDLLDLGPMIRDAIVLELPLAPLCREDCEGLCAQCGADLNTGLCGCEAPGDPRWATLDVLRRPD